jgi:hypothetical protein
LYKKEQGARKILWLGIKEEHMVSNSPTACQVWVLSKSVERAWGEHRNSFYPWFDPISCGWVVGEPKKRWQHVIYPYKTWFAAFLNKWEVRITAYIANLDLVQNKKGLQNFFFLTRFGFQLGSMALVSKVQFPKVVWIFNWFLGHVTMTSLVGGAQNQTNSGLELCHQKRGVVTWFRQKTSYTHDNRPYNFIILLTNRSSHKRFQQLKYSPKPLKRKKYWEGW